MSNKSSTNFSVNMIRSFLMWCCVAGELSVVNTRNGNKYLCAQVNNGSNPFNRLLQRHVNKPSVYYKRFHPWAGRKRSSNDSPLHINSRAFNPWGRKRHIDQDVSTRNNKQEMKGGFYPWVRKSESNDHDLGTLENRQPESQHEQRTDFLIKRLYSSLAGKRFGDEVVRKRGDTDDGGGTQAFSPWGGKRFSKRRFNSWGGKRSAPSTNYIQLTLSNPDSIIYGKTYNQPSSVIGKERTTHDDGMDLVSETEFASINIPETKQQPVDIV